MQTNELSSWLARLFAELVNGAPQGGDAFILNSGDAGLLRSLAKLSAADVSQSVNEGATIAAHARHLQYGLSLMNRWAREGATPSRTRRGIKLGRPAVSMIPNGGPFETDFSRRPAAGWRCLDRRAMSPKWSWRG